jgi:hypothetical protein
MNLNKFFTLLMGKCWHEFFNGSEYVTACIHCKHHYGDAGDNPDHLSNPLPVLEWMRENMAEELEAYCKPQRVNRPSMYPSTDYIFRILDLKNLYAYLKEHPSWGEKECPNKIGNTLPYYCHPINCGGKPCHGSGTILHPALRYAKGEEG